MPISDKEMIAILLGVLRPFTDRSGKGVSGASLAAAKEAYDAGMDHLAASGQPLPGKEQGTGALKLVPLSSQK